MINKISGKKTYTTGIGAIAVAVGMYFQDPETMPLATMVQTCITALLAMFLRSGVKKAEDKAAG
tara:strand:+ start:5226 stop:5417 length:192 start_codon:yes stop_codon:yes gene_type:complete